MAIESGKYARKCSKTNKGMNSGYVVGDGEHYFIEKTDLIQFLRGQGDKEFNKASDEFILNESYALEEYYYTEWEELDEDFYYDEDGNEFQECHKCSKMTLILTNFCTHCLAHL